VVVKIYRILSTPCHLWMRQQDFCFWGQILQTIWAQMPHQPLMNPIGAGEGAAWASLYITFLWKDSSRKVDFSASIECLISGSCKCLFSFTFPCPCVCGGCPSLCLCQWQWPCSCPCPCPCPCPRSGSCSSRSFFLRLSSITHLFLSPYASPSLFRLLSLSNRLLFYFPVFFPIYLWSSVSSSLYFFLILSLMSLP
jgi:hypothetical protein